MIAWLVTLGLIPAAYPWAAIISRDEQDVGAILTRIALTIALSAGALSLIMFWQAALGVRLDVPTITLPYVLLSLAGLWLWWRSSPQQHFRFSRPSTLTLIVLAAVLLLTAANVFNALYWPFSRADALAIYHHYGSLLAQTHALVPFQGRDEAFYQAYPQLVPMLYAYSYLLSGWENQYLARLWPALLALANLPLIYRLSQRMFQRQTVAVAALLTCASLPLFSRWASSGYVDLPMAFFYTLNAYYTWKLTTQSKQAETSAIMAGVSLGLAAWTKNAALFAIALWLVWLAYQWWKRRISLDVILMALVACFAVCGAWYARNWLEAGLLVPPTAWTDQAEHSLRTLLIFITQPMHFALSGWLIVLACLGLLVNGLRRRLTLQQQFLGWYTLPFFVIWWWTTSYDARFILLFLPLLSVLAGASLIDWLATQPKLARGLTSLLLLISLALMAYNSFLAVEFKGEILRDPLMSDAAKQQIVRPP